jgi:hypothetical protein
VFGRTEVNPLQEDANLTQAMGLFREMPLPIVSTSGFERRAKLLCDESGF